MCNFCFRDDMFLSTDCWRSVVCRARNRTFTAACYQACGMANTSLKERHRTTRIFEVCTQSIRPCASLTTFTRVVQTWLWMVVTICIQEPPTALWVSLTTVLCCGNSCHGLAKWITCWRRWQCRLRDNGKMPYRYAVMKPILRKHHSNILTSESASFCFANSAVFFTVPYYRQPFVGCMCSCSIWWLVP